MEAHVKKVSLEEFEEWRKREENRKKPSTTSTTKRSYIISTIISTTILSHEIKQEGNGKAEEEDNPGRSTTELVLSTSVPRFLSSTVPSATDYNLGERGNLH